MLALAGLSDPDADRPLVMEALMDLAPLCSDCIARKGGISSFRVDDALGPLGVAIPLIIDIGRCESCGVHGRVHRLA